MMEKNWNNADLYALLTHENGCLLYGGAEGSIVQDRSGETLLTDITDGAALEKALRALTLRQVGQVVVKSESARRAVQKLFGFRESQVCSQWVYPGAEPPVVPACGIRPLEPCHAEQAARHYGLFDNAMTYVAERIEAGRMWGLFENGALAGFIGTHTEGSMGMLEVLPEFRRRGYGIALERFLIAWHLTRGWTPFGQVIEGNEASIGLQKKAGLVRAELPAIWMF